MPPEIKTSPGIRDSFQARCDIDPVTINIIRLDNDVAEVDADPMYITAYISAFCVP